MIKNKLVILSLDSFSVFFQNTSYPFGGIEIETRHHAYGLANDYKMDVTVITKDQGFRKEKSTNVFIVPHPFYKGPGYWDKQKKIIERIKRRVLKKKMKFQNSDDFYSSLNGDYTFVQGLTPEVLEFSRYSVRHNKKFIFKTAHDNDLGDEGLSSNFFRNWCGMTIEEVKEIYNSSTVILVQTPFQKQVLLSRFNKESELLYSPLDIEISGSLVKKSYDVLWVGKDKSFKRPEKMIEVARRLPELKFMMLIHNPTNELLNQIPSNVEVNSFVPPDKVEYYFNASSLFLSTSLSEGFANTFLHAAKFGVPVVSMGSDPNGMLSEHLAGVLSGDDISNTVLKINELIRDRNYYSQYSSAAKKYVHKYHDSRVITEQFHRLLKSLN